MPIGIIVGVLTRPWVMAGIGGTTAYLLYKKNRDQRDRIKEAKVEMIEMQRTIDRLRAEIGRERGLRIEDQQGPQYQVGLTARLGGPSTCPYCKDDVIKGPACPRCAARYHDECALTYGRCAAMACGGALTVDAGVRGLAAALPRLRVVAHRLGQGRWPTAGLTEDGPPYLVALYPAPREVETRDGAVRAVAEVLGQTAFDARLRLGANVPEPLCRADDRARADQVVARLGGEQFPAFAVPLGRALRPLTSVAVDGVRVGAGGAVVHEVEADGPGRDRLLPAGELLVVSAPLVEVRKWTETVRSFGGEGTSRYGARTSPSMGSSKQSSRERRTRDPAALVFTRGDPVPVQLRASTLRSIEGVPRGPVAAQNLEAVVAALAKGGQRMDLPGATDESLMTLRLAALTARGETVTDDQRAIELAARLLSWMDGLTFDGCRPGYLYFGSVLLADVQVEAGHFLETFSSRRLPLDSLVSRTRDFARASGFSLTAHWLDLELTGYRSPGGAPASFDALLGVPPSAALVTRVRAYRRVEGQFLLRFGTNAPVPISVQKLVVEGVTELEALAQAQGAALEGRVHLADLPNHPISEEIAAQARARGEEFVRATFRRDSFVGVLMGLRSEILRLLSSCMSGVAAA